MTRKIRIRAGLALSILLFSVMGLKAQDYPKVEGGNNGHEYQLSQHPCEQYFFQTGNNIAKGYIGS